MCNNDSHVKVLYRGKEWFWLEPVSFFFFIVDNEMLRNCVTNTYYSSAKHKYIAFGHAYYITGIERIFSLSR